MMSSVSADSLVKERDRISNEVTRRFFERNPRFKERWGELGVRRCTEDTAYHLSYLAEAVRFDFPSLFIDYIGWAKVLLRCLGMSDADLIGNLRLMEEVLREKLPEEGRNAPLAIVAQALDALPGLPITVPTFLDPQAPFADLARQWMELLLHHRAAEARRAVLDAFKDGAPLLDLYQHVITPTLYEVGRLWQTKQINEAEEHYCSQVTQSTLAILNSDLHAPRIRRAVVGLCIGQERHEVGIRMVTDCFALHGWDAVCLGSNVPGRNIESILRTWNPDVVALSGTMTYHLAEMHEVIQIITNNGGKVPFIVVGGRPFNLCPGLGERMGANASASSCSELVTCTAKAFEE